MAILSGVHFIHSLLRPASFLAMGLLFLPQVSPGSSSVPACEAFASGIFPAGERGSPPNLLRVRLRRIQHDRMAEAELEARAFYAAFSSVVHDEQRSYIGIISPEPKSLVHALATEPYFAWLSEVAQAEPPLGIRFSRDWQDSPGSEELRRSLTVSFEPFAVFRAHLETRGPNRLNPELALMRIWRDFDPSLSSLTRKSMSITLARHQQQVAEDELFSRVLRDSAHFSWRLITDDISIGAERLQALELLIVTFFHQRFPEHAWRLLGQALDAPTQEIISIFSLLAEGQRAGAHDLERALQDLIPRVGLRENFSSRDLLSAIQGSGRATASNYPEFLLAAFPEVAQAFGRAGLLAEYRHARRIIELERALANNSIGHLAAVYLNELNLSY